MEKQTKELQSLQKIFTPGQLRKLKSGKQIKWAVEDVASAISLYAGGPRSYRLLRKRRYPLPGVSTLRRWAAKIDVLPGESKLFIVEWINPPTMDTTHLHEQFYFLGVLNIVLKLMKNSPLPEMERACVLLFDEVKIQKSFDYDKKTDTTLGASNYVQVVMARGICGNWKQPIFYDYDCKLTKELLFEIIKKIENVGYPVYAINSDLGGSNRGLWSDLNISENQTWFKNPVNNKNIYVFADAPHMIKLLRNHFIDTGFEINNKIVTSKPIVELLQNTKHLDLNISHKINENFLSVKGVHRQKVKLATKLFSHTISKAVSRLGYLGLYKSDNNWVECSKLLKITNDWFDVFNSKISVSDSRSRMKAYGLALNEQNEILDQMSKLMETLRKPNSKKLLPFQKGILISISSLKQLFNDMKKDFNIKYLLTYHLNQDPLEGFFSIIRSIGGLYDHPTALQFKYRLRNYIMGRNDEVISESSNVEPDDHVPNIIPSSSIRHISGNDVEKDNAEVVTGHMFSTLEVPPSSDHVDDGIITNELSKLQYDGLENLAGFIAFKLRKKRKTWVYSRPQGDFIFMGKSSF